MKPESSLVGASGSMVLRGVGLDTLGSLVKCTLVNGQTTVELTDVTLVSKKGTIQGKFPTLSVAGDYNVR